MREISPIVLFVFIMLITVGEFFLSMSWRPFFFRVGIPLFRKEFSTVGMLQPMERYIGELEAQLPRSWWQPAVVFKAISPSELAFRQKFGQRNPVRGLLLYEPTRQRLSLTGYMPWATLISPFAFIVILLWAPFAAVFLFLFVFIIGVSFAILMSRMHYGRIEQAISSTFQDGINNEFATNLPQTETPSYPSDVSLYADAYDPYSATHKKRDNSNTTVIIAVVIIVTLVSLISIAAITFFLLTSGG